MSWYSQRVERDLARWQTAGWVSDTGATAIKSDLASRKSAFGAAGIFAILGAVLFGFAIMSFVAAHWTTMSKLARLALILATLWGCYGAAAYLFAPQARRLRAGRRAGRHHRLRRRHHADRADVPHGGQPARRGALLGARGAAGGRALAIASGAGGKLRAARRVVGLGAHPEPKPRTGASCRCGSPPSRRRCGWPGDRACISPRSASSSGWSRSASSFSASTPTGWWP